MHRKKIYTMLFAFLFAAVFSACFDEKKLLTEEIVSQSIIVTNVPTEIVENAYVDITVSLENYPEGESYTVSITNSNEDVILLGRSYVILDVSNWSTGVSVRIYALDDDNSDDETATIILTSEGINSYTFDIQADDDDAFVANLSYAQLKRGIWVVGGTDGSNALSEVDFYDPTTDTWYPNVTQLPTARTNCAVVSTLNKIFVLGGMEGSSTSIKIEYYDPITNTWDTTNMTFPRSHTEAIADKGIFAISIGKNSSGVASGYTFEYNYYDDIYTYRHNYIATPRWSGTVTRAGAYYYVIGGTTDDTTGMDTVQRVPFTRWQNDADGANMTNARFGHSAVFFGNYVYVTGGYNSGLVDNINYYDTINNNWASGPDISTAGGTQRYYGAAIQINGIMYYLGGTDGSDALTTVESTNLTTSPFTNATFTTISSMPRARMAFGAVLLEE